MRRKSGLCAEKKCSPDLYVRWGRTDPGVMARGSGQVGHGAGREGRLGGRWAGGRGVDSCFCRAGGHLVLVLTEVVQRAEEGVLVAKQPDRV